MSGPTIRSIRRALRPVTGIHALTSEDPDAPPNLENSPEGVLANVVVFSVVIAR